MKSDGMHISLSWVCVCVLVFEVLQASSPSEAVPWTKSFPETRCACSVDHYALSTRGHRFAGASKHQCEGGLYATSALLPDWEFDLGVLGRSLPTHKLFVRAERQLFSDLENDPLAITALAHASSSGYQRCQSPVFFEMARNLVEAGFGIGRHLLIRKNAYTQLFGYCIGGIGSSRARYARVDFGLQHVFFLRHYLRLCLSHLKAFGSDQKPFRGIGTLNTNVNV